MWNVSAPMRSASAKVEAPAGTTMNSWRSIEFWACTPPLMTFSIGTGRTCAVRAAEPAVERDARVAAAAFAAASETPRIAFAPSRPLFGVPSSSMSAASRPALVLRVQPRDRERDLAVDVATARVTPLPR